MTVNSFKEETLTADDIREALNKVVSKKLFWGKKAAKMMNIEDVWDVLGVYSRMNLINRLKHGLPLSVFGRPSSRRVLPSGNSVLIEVVWYVDEMILK